jgi:hypothetical protein
MDHSPLEGFFKLLLPILIFIAWPMFTNAQKRKKEQEALRRRRQQDFETAKETRPKADDRSDEQIQKQEPAIDTRKRSIEDVLEEMGFPVDRHAPQPKPTHHAEEKTAPPPEMQEEESQSLEDLKPEVVPEKAIDEKTKAHLAIQEGAYTLSASPIDNPKAYSTALSGSISDSGSEFPQGKAPKAYESPKDLQKFIVWSELLGKPVALKDE